jgi:hypothetical protein
LSHSHRGGPRRAAGTVAKDLATLTIRSRSAGLPEATAGPCGILLEPRKPLCEAIIG